MSILKRIERGIRRLVPKHLHKFGRANRYELIMERAAPVPLIVHVGAHFAEDAGFYERIGARTVLWIEADPDTFTELQRVLAGRQGPTRHVAHLGLVSDTAGDVLEFHRFRGDGASSSVHRATDRLRERFGGVAETGEVLRLETSDLAGILAREGIQPGGEAAMLVLDVQGHELPVLKGAQSVLGAFRFLKCEISRIELYAGGSRFDEIDAFLGARGYRLRSHLRMLLPRHGDVLYVRD